MKRFFRGKGPWLQIVLWIKQETLEARSRGGAPRIWKKDKGILRITQRISGLGAPGVLAETPLEFEEGTSNLQANGGLRWGGSAAESWSGFCPLTASWQGRRSRLPHPKGRVFF